MSPQPNSSQAQDAPPLTDLVGCTILGLEREAGDVVILLEAPRGLRSVLAFRQVTNLWAQPAAQGVVSAIRQDADKYQFEFAPGTSAALEIWAGGHIVLHFD
jgi:hypothetical protein